MNNTIDTRTILRKSLLMRDFVPALENMYELTRIPLDHNLSQLLRKELRAELKALEVSELNRIKDWTKNKDFIKYAEAFLGEEK